MHKRADNKNAPQRLSHCLRKVLEVGKTTFKTEGGIYKMFRAWKKTKEVTGEVGRPSIMQTKEAEETVKQVLKDCCHNSSTFQLQHMKDALARKRKEKAETDRLYLESINCGISDKTVKAAMVVMAMGESTGL